MANVAAALLVVIGLVVVLRIAQRKNLDIIARDALRPRPSYDGDDGPQHIFFCVADHFEPFWQNRDVALALERVERWHALYPQRVEAFRDNGGNAPRHAFFYPQEEYTLSPQCMKKLADIVRRGFGDVEVHLHHDRDTAAALREKIVDYTRTLHDRHGLLRRHPESGLYRYAFIHGNWTLANSGRAGQYCGVDDELAVLQETGCYADFTYPSAPHHTQPPIINRIYYPRESLGGARAHHRGVDARYATPRRGDLLLFAGPLALNWRQRRRVILPAIENGDLTHLNPPKPDRIDSWVRTSVGVGDWPRWIFIKAYTHGAQERNAGRLLGDGEGSLAAMYRDLLARYNDGERYVLHFSTPWEMYCGVKALEMADASAIAAIERFDYSFQTNGL